MDTLLLASAYEERLLSWRSRLRSLASSIFVDGFLVGNGLDNLRDHLGKKNIEVLLLDLDLLGLNQTYNLVGLRRLCSETKIIVMGSDISEKLEWELLKAGIRGCCSNDDEDPEYILQVVAAVQKGEFWVRRSLTARLIDELGGTTSKIQTYKSTLALMSKLTDREYDIAIRVGNCESNKHIAHECGITVRTVKSHLTEIFIKLGITDRLNLALALASDKRLENAKPHDFSGAGSRINDVRSVDSNLPGSFTL
jgi:two-component system NarL family response regulator